MRANRFGTRRDGAFIQHQRINDMIKRLKRELMTEKWNGQIRLRWFQAIMQVEYGLNPSTTRKYLSSLEEIEMIIVDDKGGTDGKGIIMEWYDREALKLGLPPESEEKADS